MEVSSTKKISLLEENRFVVQKFSQKSPETHYFYRLASRDRKDIEFLEKDLENMKQIQSIDVRYS